MTHKTIVVCPKNGSRHIVWEPQIVFAANQSEHEINTKLNKPLGIKTKPLGSKTLHTTLKTILYQDHKKKRNKQTKQNAAQEILGTKHV